MENLEKILNKEQLEAVQYTEGPLLVLAGAGSGKTRVLTHRIAYLIENRQVAPWHILAITFTNKAAGEMRERVDRLIGAESREIWVSTFHSMCVRILRRYIENLGYATDFSIYDTDDQKTIMRQVFKELNVDTRIMKERGVLSIISGAKNEGIGPEEYEKENGADYRTRKICECYKLYERKLHENNALDFDDLLLRTLELFESCSDVLEYYQERFRYILVDEYQDTNEVQFRLVEKLAGKYRNLCVVGDDDQSIYKFRGANLENILSFERCFPGAKVVKLEQNYRSTQNILDAANAVISHNHGRKQKTLWTAEGSGERVRFQEFETANDEAYAVIKEVRDSAFGYKDQAVLYRTNAQSRLLEEQCIKMNIPYQIVGGVNFYQRKEIKDILAYLKIVANDADNVAFERVINVPKRGIGAASIEKLRMYTDLRRAEGKENCSLFACCNNTAEAGVNGKAGKEMQKFYGMILGFREKLAAGTSSIRKLIEEVRDDTGYSAELMAEGPVEAETRMQNIEELINKAAAYEAGAEKPSLGEFLEEVALVADIDRKDDEKETLVLMTLHGAKGLEFPKVYLVGMSNGLFPNAMTQNNPEDLEEERRLCYVGITRAMKELVMTSARSRMINGNFERLIPSQFIDEIPDELVEKKMLQKRYYSDMEDPEAGGMAAFRRSRGSGFTFGGDTGTDGYGILGSSGRERYGNGGDYPYAGGGLREERKKPETGIPAALKNPGIQKLEKLDYQENDRVKHIKFGEGTVLNISEGKKDFEVTVMFDSGEQKKMLASFARLKKL